MHYQPLEQVTEYLAKTISDKLQDGKRVLWLVPGGSGISTAIAVTRALVGLDLTRLTVTLTDERYGPVGHANENWKQLLEGGFTVPGARTYRVLRGDSLEQTAQQFDRELTDMFIKADYAIGLFGVGSDGHTAGIKPNTSSVSETGLVAGFVGADFERITTTFSTIRRLDEAVLFAAGETKLPVLQQLTQQAVPLTVQPVQILKEVPKFTIFTDQITNSTEE